MRLAIAILVLFGGCKDSEKDAEITRLRQQLAKQQAPPKNPQPETAAPPITDPGGDAPAKPQTVTPEQAIIIKAAQNQPMSQQEFSLLATMAGQNKAITYAHLKKNADRYVGKPWRLFGRIIEISEHEGKTVGRINLTDYGEQILWFEHTGETDFVENNAVEMIGVLGGNFSYKSQAGWDITIPAIAVTMISKRGEIDKRAGIKHRRVAEEE